MKLGWLVIAVVLVRPRPASADGADQLRAQGERLAKQGNYAEAIDAFKASDALRPRASNACYIALAYTRRQLWPQAEIFIELCHRRATATDPLPAWVAAADEQIVKKLASADVAATTLVVSPEVPDVVLTVSSFAPDEAFSPRMIHLPFGQHVVFARAPGHADAQVVIEVKDRTPQTIKIVIRSTGAAVEPPAPAAGGKTASFVSESDRRWDVLFDQQVVCATPCTVPLDPMRSVTLRSHGGLFKEAEVGYLKAGTSVVVTGRPVSTFYLVLGGGLLTAGGVTAMTGGALLVTDNMTGVVIGGIGLGIMVTSYFAFRRAMPKARVQPAPYVGTNHVGIAGRF